MTRRTPRKGRLRPGKLQLIPSAAVSTCCQFWFTEIRRKGRQSSSTATPRGRPQTRNDHDPPHTTQGPPQARQTAAYPIRCSFWFPRYHTRRSQKNPMSPACFARRTMFGKGLRLISGLPPHRTFLRHHPHQLLWTSHKFHPSLQRSEARSHLWSFVYHKRTIGLT